MYAGTSGRVVVAVPDARDARALDAMLDVAAGLSRQRRASIVLLHAMPDAASWHRPQTIDRLNAVAETRGLLADAVRRLTTRAGYRVKVQVSTSSMPPADALIDASRFADLIVMFRRRLPATHRIVHGFVTSTVALNAVCPVMVLPQHKVGGLGYALVGVVDGASSRDALAFAFEEASWRKVPLVALHAWQFDRSRRRWTPSGRCEEIGPTYEQGERVLSEALAGFVERYPDVVVRKQLVTGPLIDTMLPATRYAQVAIVGRLWGSSSTRESGERAAARLLHRSLCPVVVVPRRIGVRTGRPTMRSAASATR